MPRYRERPAGRRATLIDRGFWLRDELGLAQAVVDAARQASD